MRASPSATGSNAVDGSSEIALFVGGETTRHSRNEIAGRITPFARQFVDLPHPRRQGCFIARDGLRQRNVHIGKRCASLRKRPCREVVHHPPRFGIALLPGEFATP